MDPAADESTSDDTLLIAGCRNRQPGAIRQFVERHQTWIYRLCVRILRHDQDAEDVTQEVLQRALNHLDRCDPTRSLRPWLTTIAVNCCKTALKRRSRQPALLPEHQGPVARDQTRHRGELAEELELCLAGLKPQYRSCFVLFYQEQLSCEQIAETMNIPVNTVKTWLYRARQDLMTHLKKRQVMAEKST